MTVIKQPIINQPLVDDSGRIVEGRPREWVRLVTELAILEGSGTPEGNVEAAVTRLYMDTAGTAGNILYIKRDPDIAGDRSRGWILV